MLVSPFVLVSVYSLTCVACVCSLFLCVLMFVYLADTFTLVRYWMPLSSLLKVFSSNGLTKQSRILYVLTGESLKRSPQVY